MGYLRLSGCLLGGHGGASLLHLVHFLQLLAQPEVQFAGGAVAQNDTGGDLAHQAAPQIRGLHAGLGTDGAGRGDLVRDGVRQRLALQIEVLVLLFMLKSAVL